MTLKDYAAGGAWGESQKDTNASSAGLGRVVTAPCWRKPKGQRVDEKVQRLLTTYNEVAQSDRYNPLVHSDAQRRDFFIKKYFPGKDIPLGQKPATPEEDESMLAI